MPTLSVQFSDTQANVGHRHRTSWPTLTPTSDADFGLSVGQCCPPTLSVQFSDTQADVGRRRRCECQPSWSDVGGRRRPECQKTGWTMSAANNCRHSGRHSVCYPSALHIALWLKINKITCCNIDFQGITTNTRQKYEVHIKAKKGCNKQKYSPPMSKYAKNMRPNKSAPSFFNSSLNL